MAQPTFKQWRSNSAPITNTAGTTILVPAQDVFNRAIAAFAAYATRTNPDGTRN